MNSGGYALAVYVWMPAILYMTIYEYICLIFAT